MIASNYKAKRVSSRLDNIQGKKKEEKHFHNINNQEVSTAITDVNYGQTNFEIHHKIKEQMRKQLITTPVNLDIVDGDFISEHLNQISFAESIKLEKKRNQKVVLIVFLIFVISVITTVLYFYTKF